MRGAGYLISILSVLLLGAVAWPKPDEAQWKALALLGGIAASIIGMCLRWVASHRQAAELQQMQSRAAER
ncbi:MAG TPA: hypothetical protein VM913_03595 [Sphingomicrobium sp.]|jgi:hypothetical protein|nr:hypothetical protein [Sphingomicrobium sp.]